MISKKIFQADGSTTTFLPDFIIKSNEYCRVYVNSTVELPTSSTERVALLADVDEWEIVNNTISFYTAPASGQYVTVWVASTPEELDTYVDYAFLTYENLDNMQVIVDNLDDVQSTAEVADGLSVIITNMDDINTVADDISNVNTVAEDINNVNIAATNIGNVNKVAVIDSDVSTVSGISTNVTTTANNIDNINTVADDLNEAVSEINTVGTNIADVNSVAGSINNVNTVAINVNNVNTTAGSIANVNTTANAISNVNSVASNMTNVVSVDNNEANINSAVSNAANITTVAGSIGNVNSTGNYIANVNTVASNIDDVNTVAGNNTNIITVANNNNNVASVASNIANVNTTASNISNVNTTATNIASINNASANIDSINNFGDTYFVGDTAPTSPTEGDLWFDSSTDIMKVYNGSAWQSAGSSVNGTSERQTYTATSGQTDFASTYDAGFIDVYVNGIKLLDGTDFTATNGTTVVMSQGLSTGDIVDIVAYGTFELADVYTQAQADSLLDAKADANVTYTETEVDNLLATKADQATTYTKTEVNNKPSGFKNKIINGGFDIWQRGTTFLAPGNLTYTADRWIIGTANANPESVYIGGGVFNNSSQTLAINGNDAVTSNTLTQRIEKSNCQSFDTGTKITISGSVYLNNIPSISVNVGIRRALGVDDWASSYDFTYETLVFNQALQDFSVTLTIPNQYFKEHGTELIFAFSGVGTGDTIAFGNIQLEEGSVATPFEQRPYGLELSLCQRYYRNYNENQYSYGVRTHRDFNPTMRDIPTVTVTAGSATVNRVRNQFVTFDIYTGDIVFTADAEL